MIIRLYRQFALGLVLVGLGFVGGWSIGGARKVHADDAAPVMDVKSIDGNTSLVLYYPGQKKIYVYSAPFAGGPKSTCAYAFTLTTAGGTISRQNCNAF